MLIGNFGVLIEQDEKFDPSIQQSLVRQDYLAFVDDKGVWVHIPISLVKKLKQYNLPGITTAGIITDPVEIYLL
jgi:hypothetical protein